MSKTADVRSLFDRWERVWHQGEFDLIPSCVASNYIRHDEAGDRAVSRDDYANELAKLRSDRPDIRIIVYDHHLAPSSAWYRFTMRWTDQTSGETRTRAAIQSYRIEDGKLAETWVVFSPVGSAWSDERAQPNWTTPRS
jgi:hypothetical protein